MSAVILTSEQLEKFNIDGFLIIPDFKTGEECDNLRKHAAELVEAFNPGDHFPVFSTLEQRRLGLGEYFLNSGENISFFFEENAFDDKGKLTRPKTEAINKFGHNMHDLDPSFNAFSRDKKLEQLSKDVGLKNPLILQSMYIYKQPGIGGEVSCHQDKTFLYTDSPMLGLWFALEDATIDNACLWAIPGGHKGPLREKFVRDGTPGGTKMIHYDSSPYDLDKMVPLEAKKGTVILLHELIPHMSHVNKSSKTRQAYTLHIVDGTYDTYPEDNWLQRPTMPPRGF